MTRYTTSAGSQGELYTQRETARLAPEVECAVRKRLRRRPDGFHCDLQARYTPLPPDGAVSGGARRSNARDAVKATGPSPRMSVCGRPFGLDDPDDTGGVR